MLLFVSCISFWTNPYHSGKSELFVKVLIIERDFLSHFSQSWKANIGLMDVINFIRDVAKIPSDKICMMVIHFDETNALLTDENGRSYLRKLFILLASMVPITSSPLFSFLQNSTISPELKYILGVSIHWDSCQ